MLSIEARVSLTSTTPPPLANQCQIRVEPLHPMILKVVIGPCSARETISHRELKLAIQEKFLISRGLLGPGISDSILLLTMVGSALVSPRSSSPLEFLMGLQVSLIWQLMESPLPLPS